jgi:1-acyl-sn-glycerol-3-phosphate acyltransferase
MSANFNERFILIKDKNNNPNIDNCAKRYLYSDASLLQMDIEEDIIKSNNNENNKELLNHLTNLIDNMNLDFVKRDEYWLISKIDEIIRLSGAISCLFTFGILFAIPTILFKPIDIFLVDKNILSPSHQISIFAKQFIAYFCLVLSGINVIIEGKEHYSGLGYLCHMLCFSHTSTLDAFVLAQAFPVRSITMSKVELFLIPFFSWLLIAFDGVPIKRKNRDEAIRALTLAAESKNDRDCISLAPEGTRSTSGLLTKFKKGPFYLWEQLDKVDIVPIVSMGCYELYPPNHIMTKPGKIYVRFLKPIKGSEAKDKDHMSALVRRAMLESFKDLPNDVASELTWLQRMGNIIALISMFSFDYILIKLIIEDTLMMKFGFSSNEIILYGIILTAFITILLYFYVVEVVHWGKTKKNIKKD